MVSIKLKTPDSESNFLGEDSSVNQLLRPLTAKINAQDCLEIGGCDLPTLVERFGSPLYILDEATLRLGCQQYLQAFAKFYPGPSQVIYASKAWSCLAVSGIVASEGLGFDVVSTGELYTASRALQEMGIPSEGKIYFHGNNKSISELELAISTGAVIIVDNWLELERLAAWTQTSIQIMLRLTPGIECHTHEYIRTGHLDSKFGFDPTEVSKLFEYVKQQSHIHCLGIHAHIGSQIFEIQPHQDLAKLLVHWWEEARAYGLPIEVLNVGGGLGIRYTEQDDPPTIEQWVKTIAEAVIKACEEKQLPLPKLMAEPGRSLIATSCVTAYTVGGIKVVPGIRTYVSVDGGMSDNPRPITYGSVYTAAIANRMSSTVQEKVTVAGKHCESGDILLKEINLAKTEPGDILVVMATGAYNYSMASNYNRLPRPAAVLVGEGEANVILRRETNEDLLRQDCLPEKLRWKLV